jgi:hypothetical protein
VTKTVKKSNPITEEVLMVCDLTRLYNTTTNKIAQPAREKENINENKLKAIQRYAHTLTLFDAISQ